MIMGLNVVVAAAALLSTSAWGHGRLQVPKTRFHTIQGFDAYENDPVPSSTSDEFSCRNDPPTDNHNNLLPAQTTVTVGNKMDVQWLTSALHVGDCALYASYDYAAHGAAGRASMRWFKIANWKNCYLLTGEVQQIDLPSWLPAGRAVLRWDWYALHVFATIEFYTQCADVMIVNDNADALSSPHDVPAYPIVGLYPARGDDGVGFREELAKNTGDWVTGPPCACRLSQSNGCAFTASADASRGFINQPTIDGLFGCGPSLDAAAPTNPPTSPPPTAAVTSPPPTESVVEPTAATTTPPPTESVTMVPPTEPSLCGAPWAKCGGHGWEGATCCTVGYTCVRQDKWYSQCTPEVYSDSSSSSSEDGPECAYRVAPWGQCGGKEYGGSACCEHGYGCVYENDWWSHCKPL